MILRSIGNAAMIIALGLTGAGAFAQAGDRVEIRDVKLERQVTVVSGGKRIIVNPSVGGESGARLLDLDGDDAKDVVIQNIYLDGWTAELWLRRGDRFVEALEIGLAPKQDYADVDGNRTLEALVPIAEPDAIFFQVRGIFENDVTKPQEDLFRMFRYHEDRYVPARLECASAVRERYVAAIDALVATFRKNETAKSSSVGVISFDRQHLEAYRKELAAWRKRFEEGCVVS